MYLYNSKFVIFGLLGLGFSSAVPVVNRFNLQPFQVDLSKEVPRMLNLIKNTHLPDKSEYPGASQGIRLDTLKNLQHEWTTQFDWEKEQASMNQFKHFTAEIEGLTIHFIHEKSNNPNAIPLLLNHGWPGSFLEFIPVIKDLAQGGATSKNTTVAFDIIVPSLPGYVFSSAPPENWTIDDTARVYNTLMTEVLGYKTFATHGTDLGCGVSYSMYDNFNTSARAAHFTFLPFFPLTPEQLAANNVTLSPLEQYEESNFVSWNTVGSGYFNEQQTKPNTIGLSLYDNPVGQLAWIGEKFLNWSDPRAGSSPSVLNSNEILRGVSLYYLTKSFISSVYMYAQNPNGFKSEYTKARTDAPMLFSAFKYNVAFWPEKMAEKVGNLELYRNHDFGGHFAGLDNPPALIEDLREIGTYWTG